MRFVIASLVGGLIAVVSFNFLAYRKIDAVLYAMRLPNATAGDILLEEMLYATALAVIFIIIAFIFSARGLFTKISGPLQRLANDLRRIAGGDLSMPVRLRRQDEFKDFAADLDGMRAELNGRFTRIKGHAGKLLELAAAGQANQIDAVLRDLTAEIRSFKL